MCNCGKTITKQPSPNTEQGKSINKTVEPTVDKKNTTIIRNK